MAEQGEHEYWGDEHKPFVPAWTNDEELAALADAIVRGAEVCHAIVPDLRKLIEAVQSHPDPRLAKVGSDGKPTIGDPTEITLHGGEVAECNCDDLMVNVPLSFFTCFARYASFQRATFNAVANFAGAMFKDRAVFEAAVFWPVASFIGSKFNADATFESAIFNRNVFFPSTQFSADAIFWDVAFSEEADFSAAVFSCDTDFQNASFKHNAEFWGATFTGDAFFVEATFTGDADFSSITLERRLLLHEATFEPIARLSFHDAYLRPGSEITLPLERIKHKIVHNWQATDKSIWFDESRISHDNHFQRLQAWLVQYCIAIIAPWMDHGWPWLRKTLGMNASGTLIQGEDSSDPDKLLRAAADYNRLRDNFRHQSSTDELEDLCHFRYMDLRRKAGDLWMQSGPLLLNPKRKETQQESAADVAKQTPLNWLQWLTFDGILYWLIWRNCLGYLVRPMRPLVTAILVILIWTGLYAIGASDNTILYNGTLAENETAIDKWNDGFLTPLYFSVTTFTTLGYGDFAPTGWLRAVAGIQAILGVGLIALFTVAWGRKMIR